MSGHLHGCFVVEGEPTFIGRSDYGGKITFYPLSDCCQATGKGVEYGSGVACRACYEELDAFYGGFWSESDWQKAGYLRA
jgi:hypothetical protein